jgi:hypothetical protein
MLQEERDMLDSNCSA